MHRNPRLLLRAAASLLRPAAARAPARATPAPAPALVAPRPFFPAHRRAFSTADYGKDVDEVNRKFAEAREEIEAAMDSKETVYFDALLERLPPADADSLRRSMGLKMEQLKAELNQLDE
ncbi:uncharacterized protein LOC121054519 isoform X2 [Oryza brachyantha]|uniref:uncharacterized protein LOC121054519 isoform X2 n=1 Tax=Oryza brachyantha TaxID=4533 RepID=UPI001ADC30BB|nr:uncharacterized protein LOC121054519 isoform X2 [Oryza brachyantha]